MRDSRQKRAQEMVSKLGKLGKLGMHIDWQRVQAITGNGTFGRPHIARAMLEKGYVTSVKEAFTKYIGHNKPGYVKQEKITPQEAINRTNITVQRITRTGTPANHK
ncbi:MAG: hypothetical protein PHQ86_06790 [Dehalococcoidales bacterium]|nr:hypothetical protein [Dehalococcoidales bacterium]